MCSFRALPYDSRPTDWWQRSLCCSPLPFAKQFPHLQGCRVSPFLAAYETAEAYTESQRVGRSGMRPTSCYSLNRFDRIYVCTGCSSIGETDSNRRSQGMLAVMFLCALCCHRDDVFIIIMCHHDGCCVGLLRFLYILAAKTFFQISASTMSTQ
jgi:hypothetical protein